MAPLPFEVVEDFSQKCLDSIEAVVSLVRRWPHVIAESTAIQPDGLIEPRHSPSPARAQQLRHTDRNTEDTRDTFIFVWPSVVNREKLGGAAGNAPG